MPGGTRLAQDTFNSYFSENRKLTGRVFIVIVDLGAVFAVSPC